ncbi:hypothetical protein HDU98_002942 [Podochytrium sp. JEL0797]|nr:hypothetical protein HDU98_002942 [Podochytrium sp. JEL0797]
MHLPFISLLLPATIAAQVAPVPPISVADAQSITNRLAFLILAPGECLKQTSDLGSNPLSDNMAGLWLRAIFHDAGTFNAADGSGGLDASLLTLNESSNFEINGGLAPSLAPNKIDTGSMSNADVIALAGIVTVATCGGPQVPFRAGRQSTTVPNNFVQMLPHDPLSPVSVIQAGFERMGLTALDMVTLTVGSHSMGGARKAISPTVTNETFAPFDDTPGVFDNHIFKQVLTGKCILPIDCAFAKIPALRSIIQSFANNQSAFFEQYAISLDKMLNLTTSTLSDPIAIIIKQHADVIAQGSVGMVTNGTAVITSGASSWLAVGFGVLILSMIFA